jgi:hypothetical protein
MKNLFNKLWFQITLIFLIISLLLVGTFIIHQKNYTQEKTKQALTQNKFTSDTAQTLYPGSVIRGQGLPYSRVTLLITPNLVRAQLKTDPSGNYSYTLPLSVPEGNYNLSITIYEDNNTIKSLRTYPIQIARPIKQSLYILPLLNYSFSLTMFLIHPLNDLSFITTFSPAYAQSEEDFPEEDFTPSYSGAFSGYFGDNPFDNLNISGFEEPEEPEASYPSPDYDYSDLYAGYDTEATAADYAELFTDNSESYQYDTEATGFNLSEAGLTDPYADPYTGAGSPFFDSLYPYYSGDIGLEDLGSFIQQDFPNISGFNFTPQQEEALITQTLLKLPPLDPDSPNYSAQVAQLEQVAEHLVEDQDTVPIFFQEPAEQTSSIRLLSSGDRNPTQTTAGGSTLSNADQELQELQKLAASMPNTSHIPVIQNGEIVLQPKDQFCQENSDLCNGTSTSLSDLSNRSRELLGDIVRKLDGQGYDGVQVLCDRLNICEPLQRSESTNVPHTGNTDISSENLNDILQASYRDRLNASPECQQNHDLPYCVLLAASLGPGEGALIAGAAVSLSNLTSGEGSLMDIVNVFLVSKGFRPAANTQEGISAIDSALQSSGSQSIALSALREQLIDVLRQEVRQRVTETAQQQYLRISTDGSLIRSDAGNYARPSNVTLQTLTGSIMDSRANLTDEVKSLFGDQVVGEGSFKMTVMDPNNPSIVTSFFDYSFPDIVSRNSLSDQISFYLQHQSELQGVAPITGLVTDSRGNLVGIRSPNAGRSLSDWLIDGHTVSDEAIDRLVEQHRHNVSVAGPHGDLVVGTPNYSGSWLINPGNILVDPGTGELTIIDYHGLGDNRIVYRPMSENNRTVPQIITNGSNPAENVETNSAVYNDFTQHEAEWLGPAVHYYRDYIQGNTLTR